MVAAAPAGLRSVEGDGETIGDPESPKSAGRAADRVTAERVVLQHEGKAAAGSVVTAKPEFEGTIERLRKVDALPAHDAAGVARSARLQGVFVEGGVVGGGAGGDEGR